MTINPDLQLLKLSVQSAKLIKVLKSHFGKHLSCSYYILGLGDKTVIDGLAMFLVPKE